MSDLREVNRTNRIVILSDTHLGRGNRGGRSAEDLRPLWQGADRLIFNGDVAEINDHTCRAEAARQVLMIQEFCDEDEVDVTFLSGNHDPMISDIRQLTLCDGQVFVTHGDLLHPAISPWCADSSALRFVNEYALEVLGKEGQDSFDGQAAAAQFAASQKWDEIERKRGPQPSKLKNLIALPIKVARVFWYWNTLPRRAARFVARHSPQARYFVFGHIHRSGIWTFGQRTIINTGSYDFPSKPFGVVIEGNVMRVMPIVRDENAFRFGDEPSATFHLSAGQITNKNAAA